MSTLIEKINEINELIRSFGRNAVQEIKMKDKDGKVIAVSNATIPGVSVKSKKEHGTLVPKMPGMGKKGKAADAEDDEEDEDDEE